MFGRKIATRLPSYAGTSVPDPTLEDVVVFVARRLRFRCRAQSAREGTLIATKPLFKMSSRFMAITSPALSVVGAMLCLPQSDLLTSEEKSRPHHQLALGNYWPRPPPPQQHLVYYPRPMHVIHLLSGFRVSLPFPLLPRALPCPFLVLLLLLNPPHYIDSSI